MGTHAVIIPWPPSFYIDLKLLQEIARFLKFWVTDGICCIDELIMHTQVSLKRLRYLKYKLGS
jgi:hypothetical protein